MSTDTIPARKVEPGKLENPGDFTFSDEREFIYIVLPGQKSPDALRIEKGREGGPRVWGWDGNEEAPTLAPSILDNSTGWHGYLRNGRLESC